MGLGPLALLDLTIEEQVRLIGVMSVLDEEDVESMESLRRGNRPGWKPYQGTGHGAVAVHTLAPQSGTIEARERFATVYSSSSAPAEDQSTWAARIAAQVGVP